MASDRIATYSHLSAWVDEGCPRPFRLFALPAIALRGGRRRSAWGSAVARTEGARLSAPSDDSRSWLTQMYASFRAPLLRFLQHRLGDRQDAEDALQESFTRLAAAGQATALRNQRPYLFQIAANLLRDRAREQLRQGPMKMVSFDDPETRADEVPVDVSACPVASTEHRERLHRLEQALQELPERQREAFVLHRFDGLTQDEVADRMGISRRMVSKHLSRAFAYCEVRVRYASADQMASRPQDDAQDEPEDGA
ncbi:RNA polymerase sigma factor [Achromobacter aloeverae]